MSPRWSARVALGAFLASALVLIGSAGAVGLTLLVVGLTGGAVVLVGGYWFLARRGPLRWLGLVVAVAAVAAVIVFYWNRRDLVVALVALALLLLGGAAARHALRHATAPWMPVVDVEPPRHAYIVMNARSGGGKVGRFDLQQRAERLGAEVHLLDGSVHEDVAELARSAVQRGADLLGVAGGDGTQALVAGVAADHDVPLLVITAGTRNHFALDLGLDRSDPSTCLPALTDGQEVRVDLGMIGDRPFVNNASFGAYAEIVQNPDYRDSKIRTILTMLPEVLDASTGGELTARTGDHTLHHLQAALISNNPYGSGGMSDLFRRPRLDRGTLGLLAGRMSRAVDALNLLLPPRYRSVRAISGGTRVVIEASGPTIAAGVDGEALTVSTPVVCTVRPQALRVRLPRVRPGVPPPPPRITWRRLWQLASGSPSAGA